MVKLQSVNGQIVGKLLVGICSGQTGSTDSYSLISRTAGRYQLKNAYAVALSQLVDIFSHDFLVSSECRRYNILIGDD